MEVETRAVGLPRMRETQAMAAQELGTTLGLAFENVELLESGLYQAEP
jgi:hypothetical protein